MSLINLRLLVLRPIKPSNPKVKLPLELCVNHDAEMFYDRVASTLLLIFGGYLNREEIDIILHSQPQVVKLSTS